MKAAAVALLLIAALVSVDAQNTASSTPAPANEPQVYRSTGTRIAIGRSIHVAADEEVTDGVVVVGGSLRIDGRVRDGAVVIGGNLTLGPRSSVNGDVVLVGGGIVREPGAQVRGRVNDISFGNWDSWSIGRLSIPTVEFGDVGRWLTLLGTMFRIALLALLAVIIVVVARAPVARVGRAAAAEPARAFVVGVLAAVLFVPLLIITSIALILTIIGIPIVVLLVPAAMLAAVGALLLGFTAMACRLGEWVQDRLGVPSRSAVLATAIGLLLIVTPTVVARMAGLAPEPMRWGAWGLLATGILIEFVIWTMGLGAALMTGLGRWSTAPPPLPPPVPPVTTPGTVSPVPS